MEITLDEKWIIGMIQWELNPNHAKPKRIMNWGSPGGCTHRKNHVE